jgi:ssRNA-specific RNase YbeY (16S rRNA maturation enzyme)
MKLEGGYGLDRLAGRVLRDLGQAGVAVDIVLLNSKELGRLKARFGLKKPESVPDVLAFQEPAAFPHPERRRRVLGEVYLNKELSPDRLTFLLIHGILHLSGFSHEKKRDIVKMERLEKRLFQKFSGHRP